jgi:hypothetical protein
MDEMYMNEVVGSDDYLQHLMEVEQVKPIITMNANTNMIEYNIAQRTEEWKRLRLGVITGTRLKDVLKSDNTPVIYEMLAEIGSETIEENFVNSAMQRGIDLEPVAKALYEAKTGEIIDEVGFCKHEFHELLGLSPDGFTSSRTGALEIKCPSTKNHVKYICDDKIPADYLPQVVMYFLINAKLEWLDFVSYDDRYKPLPLWIKRVTREELSSKIVEVEEKLQVFYTKFKKYSAKLNSAK